MEHSSDQRATLPSRALDNNDTPSFFRLPLELREAIYSHLSIERDITDWTLARLTAQRMPITLYSPPPQSFLISWQFTSELQNYLDIAKTQKLMCRDHLSWTRWPHLSPAHRRLGLPLEASLTTCCRVSPDHSPCDDPSDCQAADEIRWHEAALVDLCSRKPHLQPLQTLRVDLYVSWRENDEGVWPVSQHGDALRVAVNDLVKLGPLTRLRVYKLYDPDAGTLEDQHDLWVSWTKEKGWQVPQKRSDQLRSAA